MSDLTSEVDIISGFITNLTKQTIIILPTIFLSLIIFLVFWIVAIGFKRIVLKIGQYTDPDKVKILNLLGSALKMIILIIGMITSLETLGVDVTAMITGLGLTGFALSFALKDALSNILAGVLILFYQPFKCGDRITVSGCEGVVIDVNLRYTKLKNLDKDFLIPNSICFNNWVAINKDNSD